MLQQAETLCRSRGTRLTPLRREVLRIILQAGKPMGAYAILDALKAAEMGAQAPPTVYRALDFLLTEHLVHRLSTINMFVACIHPTHQHGAQFLICTQCGAVIELDHQVLDATLHQIAQQYGFAIHSKAIEMSGLCAQCINADGSPTIVSSPP